jgi:hypothetical protein
MCVSNRDILRRILKCGANYTYGNGKNAKLEVIAAVLMKIQVVWDMIACRLVLGYLDTEYGWLFGNTVTIYQ